MHAGLHLRAVFPTGRASKVRERSQDIWGKQREQASE
ncbi:hypothetical protein Ahy_A06g029928 isoform C [Arachis hypogaea]|uniref:Uncharacterized protein n=1 Tax=Arachis hypogaea TaxID=3818 RepID=A0A445CUM5_ARAHY|nr:hypothetical protein Ahy_A06g029928 isoform C [Arachis hypogaea]